MLSQITRASERRRSATRRVVLAISLAISALGLAVAGRASTPPATWPVTGLVDSQKRAVEVGDINNSGDIIGRVQVGTSPAHGFPVYQGVMTVNGQLRPLPTPTGLGVGADIEPQDINDNGDVVGYYQADDTSTQGFLYRAGAYTSLNQQLGGNFAVATGINNSGEIIGFTNQGGFALLPSGSVIQLPGLIPTRINKNGHIVGYVAADRSPFFFADLNQDTTAEPNEIIPLQFPDGAKKGNYLGLNDKDQICGSYGDSSNQHHAVTWANGQAGTPPVDLPGSPGSYAQALGINNNGDVVGDGPNGATVWPKGGNPISIPEHIVDGPLESQLQFVSRINDSGQALGEAYILIASNPQRVTLLTGVIIAIPGLGGGGGTQPKLQNLSITPSTITGTQSLTVKYSATQVIPNGSTARLNFYAGTDTSATPFEFFTVTINSTSATSKNYSATLTAANALDILNHMPKGAALISAVLVGDGSLGKTNTVALKPKVTTPPTPKLTTLAITPSSVTGSAPLGIKLTFTQVVPSGTVVTLSFYEGASATGTAKYSFTITQSSTGTSKTYSATLPAQPVNGSPSVAALLQSLSASATQVTALAVGNGTLGQTNAVTLNIVKPASPLHLLSASITPDPLHTTTPSSDIKVSVTFNQVFTSPQTITISALGGLVQFPVTVKPSGSPTVSLSGKDIKKLATSLPKAPPGDYPITVTYNTDSVSVTVHLLQ